MNAMHFVAARQLGSYGSSRIAAEDAGSEDEVEEEEDTQEVHNASVRITTLPPAVSRKAAAILQERHKALRRPLALKCQKKRMKLGVSCVDSSSSGEEEEDSSNENSASSSDSDGNPRKKKTDPAWLVLLRKRLPPVDWVPKLTFSSVKADIVAGITVGVMVIPQGMSYARLAGLDYIYGMYAACVPALVYAFFGQSRQLAVGPVAMVSLVLEGGLSHVLTKEQCPEWYDQLRNSTATQADLCPEEYAGAAFLTSLAIGVIQMLASALGLSFLVTFLGHPVISGFSSGAAIIIGFSQMKYMLGVEIQRSEEVYITVFELAKALPKANWVTALLGFTWLGFLFATKKLSQRNKRLKFLGPIGPLVCCTAGILLLGFCKTLHNDFNVQYLGKVPSGSLPVSINQLHLGNLAAVLTTAVTASLIGFMESIAISKNLASQNGYELEAGQELLALGAANVVGSIFSCYPTTGSFSRSAVNNTTGAQTQLAGLVTGVVMFCTLRFLTPLFFYLPKFALSAIVVNSVISLVAYDVAIELWKVKKYDFFLWVIAFIGTLLLGVLPGVAVAVLASLMVVIYESVRPSITVLWRVPGTTMYRSIEQESRGVLVPNMFIARIGASMYFANSSYIKDLLLAYISDLENISPVQYVVLDMSSVNSLDSTAVHTIKDIVEDFRYRGMEVAFVTVGSYVEKVMTRAHVLHYIGGRWIFHSVHAAVRGCLTHQQHSTPAISNRSFSQVASDSEDAESQAGGSRRRRNRRTTTVTVGLEAGGGEVGFSNETHRDATVAFITLERDVPGISDVILSVFRQNGVEVPRREISGLTHSYYLQAPGRQPAKLADEEMEHLKAELDIAIARCSRDKFPDDARTLELERELQEARERIKALESELAVKGGPQPGNRCFFAQKPSREEPLRQ